MRSLPFNLCVISGGFSVSFFRFSICRSSKKKGQGGRRNKRLGNAASSSSAGAAGSGKRGNKKRGKRTPNVGDARTTVKRQQTR